MKVTAENLNKHEIALDIVVEAKDVSKAINEAVKNIARQVNIPGFRKGKAPRKVIEMNYGKDAVLSEAFELLVNKNYVKALTEGGYEPVSAPNVEKIKFEEGQDCEFKATFTNKPEVKLGQYKDLDVKKDAVVVTDEDVKKQLENIQNQFATMVVTPEGTELSKDDFAIIDFEGFIDGVPFDGGKGQSYPLQIGSGSFIPGFEDQLLGAKAGDDVTVKVAFPADYHVEALAGKDSEFKVHIHDIKRKQLPELTDEFAKEVSAYQTMAELEADLKAKLTKEAEFRAEEKYAQELIATAVKNSEVDIPEVMIDEQVEELLYELDMRLQTQGGNLDNYLALTGTSIDELKKQYRNAAENKVRDELVLEAIVKAENITVSNDDLNFEIMTMAHNFGADPREVFEIIVKEGRVAKLRQTAAIKKAVAFLIKNAKGNKEEQTAE